MHNNETPMHTRLQGLYAFQKSKHAIIKYHHSMFDTMALNIVSFLD